MSAFLAYQNIDTSTNLKKIYMEKSKNTVTLDLETYNFLRDFEKEIKAGNTCRIYMGWGNKIEFIGTDKALAELNNKIESLEKEITDLKHQNKNQPTIEEIKKMSWWQFRKRKRRNFSTKAD